RIRSAEYAYGAEALLSVRGFEAQDAGGGNGREGEGGSGSDVVNGVVASAIGGVMGDHGFLPAHGLHFDVGQGRRIRRIGFAVGGSEQGIGYGARIGSLENVRADDLPGSLALHG